MHHDVIGSRMLAHPIPIAIDLIRFSVSPCLVILLCQWIGRLLAFGFSVVLLTEHCVLFATSRG